MQQSPAATLTVKSVKLPNGVTLQFAEQGDPSGLPVVFLHGATDSWLSFGGVLPHLPAWIRALAITMRGHGASSRPDTGYRFADFADDVKLFLDAANVRAALIVGHSMGSYVAQRFALDHPSRTLGLVLMGSFPELRTNPVIQELSAQVATLTDPVDPVFAREFQESTLARPITPAALDAFVRESLKVPARVWRATFEEFLATDFSSELGAIETPTLIVWGDRDAIFPRNNQLALRDSIQGARLEVYAGAGHAVHWEDPQRFAADLVSFAHSIGA